MPDAHFSALASGGAAPTADLDMLKTLYREHTDQARHHETARAQATNLILVLAAVLTGLVTTKSSFGAQGIILTGWAIVGLGVFGVLLSLKHHERNRLHLTIARTYRDYLAARLSDSTIRELSGFGREEHVAKPLWGAMNRVHLFYLWSVLNGFIALLGLAIILGCAPC